MRKTFSDLICELAVQNPNMIMLTGDHGYALFDQFRKSHSDRFINAGVAEQNMIGVAAGLSKAGMLPVVYGLSSFVPMRTLEQIKMDLCYENLPCILIGDGAGVTYSYLGSSHQCTEDIAALRAIPNLIILSPADRFEFLYAFKYAAQAKGPVYIRIGKDELGDIHNKVPDTQPGNILEVIKNPTSKVAIIATGSMVSVAKQITESSEQATDLYSAVVLKPMNQDQLEHLAKKYDSIITIEEHSILGGLGSTVCELTSKNGSPKILRIGIEDKFSKYAGSYSYLMKEHGLDIESVRTKINQFLKYAADNK